MDRSQWLEERRKGIGASDAAAVCGVSPWGSPLSVYLDKLGLLPDRPNEAMRWGTRLESVVAAAYVEETGRPVSIPDEPLWWHPSIKWMCATPDRIAADRVVELKTARTTEGWGEPGTDEIPDPYLCQVTHQMAVAGIELADVAVLIAGSEFRVYTVPLSFPLLDQIVQMESDFWQRVEQRAPPPPDWTDPRTPELLALLHRPTAGKVVELTHDAEYDLVAYHEAGQQLRAIERERQLAKARLIEAMGDAEIATGPGRTLEIVRRTVTRRECVHPECTYVDFRVRRAKERAS